jgi:hypothetical protein
MVKTIFAKRNGGRNSIVTERDSRTLRTVSNIHITTAAQLTAELKKTLFHKIYPT